MTSTATRQAIEGSLNLGRFFVANGYHLRIEQADEEVPWELMLGHLLDPAVTRKRERFHSWHLYLDEVDSPAATPVISLRWQTTKSQIHVTRQILTHGHEAYEDAPGVIMTRPTQKWVVELVGSLSEAEATPEALRELVFQAVIGTSRLPITSLESPLPAYSLGTLGYLPDLPPNDTPSTNALELLAIALASDCPPLQQAKALETALRADAETDAARILTILREGTQGHDDVSRLIRTVFNTAALSPYTHFSDALIQIVVGLGATPWFGRAEALKLLGYMLRHLCRHLTAFDLTLFHNLGANYPDALFLDSLLKAFVGLVEQDAAWVLAPENQMLRRALREACVLRKSYEGHRVPDAPTSMGENSRVWPKSFVRVPEEQIYEASKRSRKLFADEPTEQLLTDVTRSVLDASMVDLDDASELRELGIALYLDRPLGVLKSPGEIDRTPLVSYEAYSRFVAARRLATIKSARWIDAARHEHLQSRLTSVAPSGLRSSEVYAVERPGVVSIADANKAAPDFVFRRSTRGSLNELLACYEWSELASRFAPLLRWLQEDGDVLLVQFRDESSQQPTLCAYAGDKLRLELGFPDRRSTMALYRQWTGVEVVDRLRVLQAWDASTDRLVELEGVPLWVTAWSYSP